MKRRFPILGAILIFIGGAGLAWLSSMQVSPWTRFGGPRGPWGPGGYFMGPGMMGGLGPGWMGGGWARPYEKRAYASNGEQIYSTGTSATTGPIPVVGGPMWMQVGGYGCVACHGVTGRGGVPVMMGTAIPPDIRYEALIKGVYEHGKKETPYTDALIKRAITKGLDPDGEPLDWTMPRWQMTDGDLNDLLAYLKTLP